MREKGGTNLSHVGIATVFLSHAWKYDFLMVLQIVLAWCSKSGIDKKSCFVWFDIFTVNQHSGITDFQYWSQGFEKSIQTIGHVLIILFPWDKPIWLSRAWCLYEFWAVLSKKVKHEFLLPEQDKPKFIDFLVRGGRFEDVMQGVDISAAESGDKAAERQIKEAVASRGGFAALNEAVTGGLRAWFLQVSDEALATIAPGPGRLTGDLQLTAANMRMTMGRVDEAVAMLEERLAALRDGESSESPPGERLASTLWVLGTAYSVQGHNDRAHAAFSEAIALRRAVLGENHPATAAAMMSLGLTLYKQGRLDEAVAQLTAALAVQRAAAGENHQQTAAILMNLGSARLAQGQAELALTHFNAALGVQREALGPGHAETAQTMMNIGMVRFQQGRVDEGLAGFQSALAIQRAALGDQHPDTAQTRLNLGAAYLQLNRLDEALEQYAAALAAQRATLGERHEHTAQTTMQIGAAYLKQGRPGPALEQFEAALAVQREVLGPGHPQTAQTMMNIGTAHMQQGRADLCLEQYRAALAAQRAARGDGDPETAGMRANLGTVCVQLGRLDEALEHFEGALEVQRARLGEGHPQTVQTAMCVAAVRQMMAGVKPGVPV